MYVSQKTGIVVLGGEIISSTFKVGRDGKMLATYEIQTTGVDWTDPTGQKGAKSIKWLISAWNYAASAADPEEPYPEKYLIVEAIPESTKQEVFRTETNRPKETIKLKALFAEPIREGRERLINTVKYHRPGTMYPPWWRPDMYKDDDPNITGKYDDNHDYGLGFQDDMRDDMEFFYEDERWSRD